MGSNSIAVETATSIFTNELDKVISEESSQTPPATESTESSDGQVKFMGLAYNLGNIPTANKTQITNTNTQNKGSSFDALAGHQSIFRRAGSAPLIGKFAFVCYSSFT